MANRLTDAEIEARLKTAIDDATPDMLDTLMAEIQHEPAAPERNEEMQSDARQTVGRNKRRTMYRTLAGCAAALLLFVGAFTMFQRGQDEVFAVVDIDVNPSVELSINEEHEILHAKALNGDGEIILDGMDLEGTDINTACNALIGSMLKHGYLSEQANSVMVSVQSEDMSGGAAIEQMVSGNLHQSLTDAKIDGAVLGKYVDVDEEISAMAADNGISFGKAWLISNLLATNSKHMTEKALLELSTQELILLGQERGVDADDFYGNVDTSKYISKEDAMRIALQSAGLGETQLTQSDIEFDCDDGIITYEVEFHANGQEYEYDINAETGEVLKYELDADDDDADDRDDDTDDVDDDDDDDHDADHDDDDDDDDHDHDSDHDDDDGDDD